MSLVKADERGRVTLGKEIVQRFGRKFEVVPSRRDIVLVPIPKDPVEDLRRIAREAGISKLSVKELKEEALRAAEEEAMKRYKGR